MHLRHGHYGEPGKDPDGEQGEDQDETAKDLNSTFPNSDRHGRYDPLRLPDFHGWPSTSLTSDRYILLAFNQKPLSLPSTRGGDQASCTTAFPLPGGGEERPHAAPCCRLLSAGKHRSQSSYKVPDLHILLLGFCLVIFSLLKPTGKRGRTSSRTSLGWQLFLCWVKLLTCKYT